MVQNNESACVMRQRRYFETTVGGWLIGDGGRGVAWGTRALASEKNSLKNVAAASLSSPPSIISTGTMPLSVSNAFAASAPAEVDGVVGASLSPSGSGDRALRAPLGVDMITASKHSGRKHSA